MASELKNKFSYQVIASAAQVLVPFVTYPYITRVLGPASLGRVNYVDFLSQVFIILAAFGIPVYAVREIAAARNDITKRSTLVKEILLLQAIFCSLATIIFILLTYRNWRDEPVLYVIAVINIIVNSFSFDWYIQGMEAFKFAAIRAIIIKLSIITALFSLVKTNNDYSLYFAVFTAAVLATSFFNGYKLFSENNFTNRTIDPRRHLKPLWHFFLTSSAISIYVYFDTIILQYITHNEQSVGYYSFILKMVKIFLVAILAVSTVMIPRLSFLVSTGDNAAIERHMNRLLQFIIVACVPVSSGLFILAPEIIETFGGQQFLPAVPLMRILAFLPLIIGLSNLFCFQTLVPFKQERKFLTAVIAGCIASLSLNFLLIPWFKESGAAYACISTELLITIIAGIQANKLVHFIFDKRLIVQTIFSVLLFVPVILMCKMLFHSSLIILLITIPVCAIIYLNTQYRIFKNAAITDIIEYLTTLLKR